MEKYRSLIHGKPSYHDYFVVNWCFHNICNFACSYCPDSLHNGTERGVSLEVVTKFCDNIIKTTTKKKVFFEFTGGEMTYYRHFSELFEYLKARGAETGLISNGSRDMAWWTRHRHLIDHICLSFHAEEGKMDHFYEVVRYLNETVTTHVNIMMLPEKFDELYAFASKIAATIDGVSISMQPLMEGMNGDLFAYSPEHKALLDHQALPWKENVLYGGNQDKEYKVYRGEMRKEYDDGSTVVVSTPELISKKENNWFGWNCFIGLENIVVDLRGNVMRGWCGVGGVIGNVVDPQFKLPSQPIVCTSRHCACGLDIMATKVVKA